MIRLLAILISIMILVIEKQIKNSMSVWNYLRSVVWNIIKPVTGLSPGVGKIIVINGKVCWL
jgi:hypothetical protein